MTSLLPSIKLGHFIIGDSKPKFNWHHTIAYFPSSSTGLGHGTDAITLTP